MGGYNQGQNMGQQQNMGQHGNQGMGQQNQQMGHQGNMGQQQQMNMPPQQQRMVQPQPMQNQMPQQPMPGAPGMPQMPNPNQNQGMPQGMGNPNNMSIAQKYASATFKFIPALNPNNPHLKQQVGSCIYEYVQHLVGDEKAPKITGMLIELPVNQIKEYMLDYNNLQLKVQEALNHWENAQKEHTGQ